MRNFFKKNVSMRKRKKFNEKKFDKKSFAKSIEKFEEKNFYIKKFQFFYVKIFLFKLFNFASKLNVKTRIPCVCRVAWTTIDLQNARQTCVSCWLDVHVHGCTPYPRSKLRKLEEYVRTDIRWLACCWDSGRGI